jgi:hypothetical protein
MTSDRPPFGKTWSRVSLIRTLTGAKAQIFASAVVGLLAWVNVISVKVPFYFLNKATLVVKEAASFVASEATHIIPDILDRFEQNRFSIADTTHIVVAAAVFYLGYRFFRRIWQALNKVHPTHWDIWPRFGLRRKLLLASLLAAGVVAAWQLRAFPWIGYQFLGLGHQALGQPSLQNLSNVSQWLWHGFVAIYENKGTMFPAVKGVLAALATYATLEVARAMADLVSPAARLGHTVYGHAYPWLADVKLSPSQKDWLHGIGSVTGGLIFGFSDLSFPSIPVWACVVLAPGLFLFAKERPNLVSAVSKVGLILGRCFRTAAELTLAQPKWVGGITAGFMVGIAAADALFASNPLLGFGIISGVIKSAYTGATIALLIAAGRGLGALAAHTRQVTGQLTVCATEVRRDMLRAAAKITKPVLKIGKAALTLTWCAKTGTIIKREAHPRIRSDCTWLEFKARV